MLCILVLCIVALLLVVRGFQEIIPTIDDSIELFPEKPVNAEVVDERIAIALDAGHGGADGGADEHMIEKDMTEATVRYLEEILLQDSNYRVVLCRDYTQGASIDERCAVANDESVDILLSVHGNTDPTRTATGFECFPTPPGRTYHEQSLAFAQIVARKMGEQGQRLRGDNGVRYKYYEELANGKTKELIVEESVTQVYEAKSFGVLERTFAPAVLVEQCFLTSQSDVQAWASDEGCRKAAQLYYEAICEYFATEPVAIS